MREGTVLDGRDLVGALEGAIVRLRTEDPFLPVHVLVPTPLLGTWLGRSIFADTGHVAVHFERPEELAWRIVEREALAAGERKVPEFADLAMVLAAAEDELARGDLPEYLKTALRTRGFAPAALRTLHDLDAAGVGGDDLERHAPSSASPERLQLLARLGRGLEKRLQQARLVSRAALLRRAAQAGARPEIGAVVACALGEVSPALAALLSALARAYPFAWIARPSRPATAPRRSARLEALAQSLPAVREAEPSAPPAPRSALARLQAGLFDGAAEGASKGRATRPASLDASLRILAASGEHLEAVEIARMIAEATTRDGLRHAEIAVLLRGGAAEAGALDAAFERAGIDAFFFEATPRVDPAARALHLLLGLLDRDFERARVMELLTTAQIRWGEVLGEEAEWSAARWDRLTAEIGIVGGLEQWRRGLARARGKAHDTAVRFERDPDDERDVRLVDSLGRLLDRLAADLAAFPSGSGWGDCLDATLRLADRWIERTGAVRQRLERALRPLAAHAPAPTRAEFLARVEELLASQTNREGALGEPRVFVGSIADAAGMRFRLVFVPGLAERRFPAIARPDPLLLDDERRAISPALRTTDDTQERERLLFEEAVLAATERLVLSYPRVDAAGRESVPSSFLLRAAEAAIGRRLSTAELLEIAEPGETVLGRAWPEDPARAIDVLERDLGLVAAGRPGSARHLAEDAPHLARAREADRAGWQRALTPWDGCLDLADADTARWAERLRVGGRSSATRLQDFAACPYRHFLKRGLGLYRWEEPGRSYQLEAKDAGSLYHEALERTYLRLRDEKLLPVRPERLARAQDVARESIRAVLDEAAAEGVVVHRGLLDPLAVDMVRDFDELLRREAEAEDGFLPSEFEKEFAEVRLAFGDGKEVSLRGKLDRVDLAQNPARVRVIDYKTGGFRFEEGQEWNGGTELQLALYNLAAESLYPKRQVTEALYLFVTEKGGFLDKACPNTAEKRETLRAILGRLDALAAAGVFAPSADNCLFCDYQPICGPEAVREARAQRKADDPRLAELRELRKLR